MNSLVFNFIKKGIIIPLAITALFIAGIAVVAPELGKRYQTTYPAQVSQQLEYEKIDYDLFKDLKSDDTIGYMSSDDISLSSNILFNTQKANYASLSKKSSEPWNNGCVIVFGNNVISQFKSLHNAGIGNKIDFEIYGHDKYTYKITKIVHNQTQEDIEAFKQDNTLIMCLSYNDFSNLGNSYFYTLYIAELV